MICSEKQGGRHFNTFLSGSKGVDEESYGGKQWNNALIELEKTLAFRKYRCDRKSLRFYAFVSRSSSVEKITTKLRSMSGKLCS